MSDEFQQLLSEFKVYCEDNSKRYRRAGWGYYLFAYLLTIVTVLASIIAGILAIYYGGGENVKLLGAVALVPAASTSVASQLKLTDKANWFYNGSTEYMIMARDFAILGAAGATKDDVAAAKDRLNQMESKADRAWSERLSFFFDKPEE